MQTMKLGRFSTRLPALVGTLGLVGACSVPALADDAHAHSAAAQSQDFSKDSSRRGGELVRIVRDATRRFQNVHAAEAEGYALMFGCVSGESDGAMGLHYVNMELLKKGELEPTRPQIVIYEAEPNGHLRLIGADFLVFKAAWDATHKTPPQLMGQALHLFDAPNRFRLDPFYTLHVWAWKDNPNGAFVNWHPNVSCESYVDPNPSP
jgi:hypothetical protein